MIRDLVASWRGGLAFTAVFVLVTFIRLPLMGFAFHPAILLNLVVVFAAGCVVTLPLLRMVRRRPARHRLLIGMWAAALPFAALGATVGGLFGPIGVVVHAAIPAFVALGAARLVIALTR